MRKLYRRFNQICAKCCLIGITPQPSKSEVICSSAVSGVSQAPFDVMKFVPANEATLFGALIGDAERIG